MSGTVVINAGELKRIIDSAEVAVHALRDAIEILNEVEHDERTHRAIEVLMRGLLAVGEVNRK